MKRISQIEEFGRIHRKALERNWDQAIAKVSNERGCRVCGSMPVQCAHIVGRTHDKKAPLRPIDASVSSAEDWGSTFVVPDRIVPLCDYHHREYDAHRLDLLPYLTLHEVLQAVADSATGRENGLEKARIRLTGER